MKKERDVFQKSQKVNKAGCGYEDRYKVHNFFI